MAFYGEPHALFEGSVLLYRRNPLRGKSTRSGRCASNCAVKKDT